MAARKKPDQPKSAPKSPAPGGEHSEKKPAGLLGKLLSKAKAAPEKPAPKKKGKPVMTLEGQEAEVIDTFTSSDALLKVAKGSQEAAKARAGEIVKNHYLRMCIEYGYKPENPSVSTAVSKCNFQVKHVSKLKRQPAPNGQMLTVEEQLQQLGFGPEVIEAIVSKVVKEKPQLGLKKFTDLTSDNATTAERAVADKLMELVDKHLTEEEQSLVLEHSIDTTVDEGWKDLAVQLAVKTATGADGQVDVQKGVKALEKLYSVLPPQFVLAQMVFSGELSVALGRLQHQPAEKKIIKSGSGKYEAECDGNDVTLYLVKPDDQGRETLGTKHCTSASHAEMSARKWFRDPEALAEQLVAFAK